MSADGQKPAEHDDAKGKAEEKGKKKNRKGKKRAREPESGEEEVPEPARSSHRRSSRLNAMKPVDNMDSFMHGRDGRDRELSAGMKASLASASEPKRRKVQQQLNAMDDADFYKANIMAAPDTSDTTSTGSSIAPGSIHAPTTAVPPSSSSAVATELTPVPGSHIGTPVESEASPALIPAAASSAPAPAAPVAADLTPVSTANPQKTAASLSTPVKDGGLTSTQAANSTCATSPIPSPSNVDGAAVTVTREGGPNRIPSAKPRLGSTAKPANLPSKPKPKPKILLPLPKFPDSGPEFYDHYKKYLLSEMHDEPLWVQAVDAWYNFEKSRGFPAKSKGKDLIVTEERPSAIATWVRNGRKKDPVEIEDGAAHRKSLLKWWDTLQPDWRKQGEKYDKGDEHDWGSLDADGRNGLLSVLACMLWWRKIEKGTKKDSPDWVKLVSDVTLVLGELVTESQEVVSNESIS